MKIGVVQLQKIIQEECSHLLAENKMQDLATKLDMAIPLYGPYALKSLIEDYEYYTQQAGETPFIDGFLAGLTFSIDEDDVIHLTSSEIDLTWNDKAKKWEGFETGETITKPAKADAEDDVSLPTTYHPDFDKTNFEANKKMLKRFSGSIAGLKALFQGAGFLYGDEEIDFPTYIGVSDVYFDDLTLDDGRQVRSISIQDPEGIYTWDPVEKFWIEKFEDLEDFE